jgi:Transposase
MGRHKEEDLARWRGLVSEQAASGRSVAGFCRDHGLRAWQLYEWKKRLRATEVTPFIAVEVASTEVASAEPGRMSGIEMRHRRGWSVIVEPGFDASHLRRLLAVLETAS